MSNNNYKVIGSDGTEIRNSEHPLHPGYLIEMEIEARELKKQDVAHDLGIRPQHLSELIVEKRNVSAMLALKLERVFGVDADYWLRVQSS
jgi:addiction module HigA family antidote